MSVSTYAKTLFEDFISIIYPEVCLGCNNTLVKGEQYLCLTCSSSLAKANFKSLTENALYQKVGFDKHVCGAVAFLEYR